MAARNPDRRLLDLNASRKARREAQKAKPKIVKLGTKQFELPGSMPMAAMFGFTELQNGDVEGFRTVLEAFFGDRTDDVIKAGLELDDLDEIMALYGEDHDPGKARRSAKSSSSTSTPSSSTSKPSTD